jgi:hypothetical protein
MSIKPTSPEKLPYETYAFEVKRIAQWYLGNQHRELIIDDGIKRLYKLLILYFTDDPDFEKYGLETKQGDIKFSLNKGILLIGPTGRSKTFVFEYLFKTFSRIYNPSKQYRIINSYAIQSAFEQDGIKALDKFRTGWRQNSPDDLYIDEIGIESLDVKHFGNKQNPIQSLLHERHRLFISSAGKIKTHGSTNLVLSSENGTNLRTFYGDRIYSRIFELFNIIITSGNDLRIII